MTIRRQLVNFGRTTTDYRVGCGALGELDSLLSHVVGSPKRAMLVCDALVSDEVHELARRALIDVGFSIEEVRFGADASLTRLADADALLARIADAAITADDLIVAVGGFELCSLVSYCSTVWCQGTSSVAIPLTLDAMCSVATSMRQLDVGDAVEMVGILPHWDMVVCDIDLVTARPVDEVGMGYVQLVSCALAESKRAWEQFPDLADGMLAGREKAFADALCRAQTARGSAIRSANPSSRNAVLYGTVTARALRACIDGDAPAYRLLAEGMRFEARLAHDVCGFEADTLFDQDDLLEDLGIEELVFELDADRFIEALRRERFSRSNRFMLALPRFPGSIRLANVDDDVLHRHAEAFLASRRPDADADR